MLDEERKVKDCKNMQEKNCIRPLKKPFTRQIQKPYKVCNQQNPSGCISIKESNETPTEIDNWCPNDDNLGINSNIPCIGWTSTTDTKSESTLKSFISIIKNDNDDKKCNTDTHQYNSNTKECIELSMTGIPIFKEIINNSQLSHIKKFQELEKKYMEMNKADDYTNVINDKYCKLDETYCAYCDLNIKNFPCRDLNQGIGTPNADCSILMKNANKKCTDWNTLKSEYERNNIIFIVPPGEDKKTTMEKEFNYDKLYPNFKELLLKNVSDEDKKYDKQINDINNLKFDEISKPNIELVHIYCNKIIYMIYSGLIHISIYQNNSNWLDILFNEITSFNNSLKRYEINRIENYNIPSEDIIISYITNLIYNKYDNEYRDNPDKFRNITKDTYKTQFINNFNELKKRDIDALQEIENKILEQKKNKSTQGGSSNIFIDKQMQQYFSEYYFDINNDNDNENNNENQDKKFNNNFNDKYQDGGFYNRNQYGGFDNDYYNKLNQVKTNNPTLPADALLEAMKTELKIWLAQRLGKKQHNYEQKWTQTIGTIDTIKDNVKKYYTELSCAFQTAVGEISEAGKRELANKEYSSILDNIINNYMCLYNLVSYNYTNKILNNQPEIIKLQEEIKQLETILSEKQSIIYNTQINNNPAKEFMNNAYNKLYSTGTIAVTSFKSLFTELSTMQIICAGLIGYCILTNRDLILYRIGLWKYKHFRCILAKIEPGTVHMEDKYYKIFCTQYLNDWNIEEKGGFVGFIKFYILGNRPTYLNLPNSNNRDIEYAQFLYKIIKTDIITGSNTSYTFTDLHQTKQLYFSNSIESIPTDMIFSELAVLCSNIINTSNYIYNAIDNSLQQLLNRIIYNTFNKLDSETQNNYTKLKKKLYHTKINNNPTKNEAIDIIHIKNAIKYTALSTLTSFINPEFPRKKISTIIEYLIDNHQTAITIIDNLLLQEGGSKKKGSMKRESKKRGSKISQKEEIKYLNII